MLCEIVFYRDHKGRSPLHLAAMEGYTNTMQVLLATHSQLLNYQDDDGVSIQIVDNCHFPPKFVVHVLTMK